MKSLLTVSLVGWTFVSFATTTSYEWDPSARTEQFGSVTVGYSEGANTVTNVVMDAGADDTVRMTGSAAFEFAADATVNVKRGNLQLETPVSGGAVTVCSDPSPAATVCSTEYFNDWFYGDRDTLIFPGKKVADYEFAEVYILSRSANPELENTRVTTPGYVYRTEDTLSAEFQFMDHNVKDHGVRVTMRDTEDGIVARVDYARNAWLAYLYEFALGELSLAQLQAKGGAELEVARSESAYGLGVRSVTLRRRNTGANVMSVVGSSYAVSSTKVSEGARLVVDGADVGTSFAGGIELSNGGELVFRNIPALKSTGAFKATGGRLGLEVDGQDGGPVRRTAHAEVTLNGPTEKCVLSNVRVDDIVSVDVDRIYGSDESGVKPLTCFVKKTAGRYEFQLQLISGSWIKGTRYVLYQKETDVYGYKTDSWYAPSDVYPTPGAIDFTSPDFKFTGHNNDAMYYLKAIDVTLDEKPHMYARFAKLESSTSYGLEVDVGTGVLMKVDHVQGCTLPAHGYARVAGELLVTEKGALGSSELHVLPGGAVCVSGPDTIPNTFIYQSIRLDGGELSALDAFQSYLNTPVFRNGGKATGLGFRVGAFDVTWRVEGTSPSSCEAPLQFVSGGTGDGELVMDWHVEDVTGDERTDFFVNASISEYRDGADTSNGGMIHRKTGAGTMRWGGLGTCTGLVQLVEGTLLLGRTNAINPGTDADIQLRACQPIEFRGGTLAAEAGTVNVVRSISILSGTSSLILEQGSALICTSSGIPELAPGAKLNVTMAEGVEFRINTRLTAEQLRAIRINGLRAVQGDDYKLTGVQTGLMLIFR